MCIFYFLLGMFLRSFAAFNERKLGFEIDSIQGVGDKWKSWSVFIVIRLSDTWSILLNIPVPYSW